MSSHLPNYLRAHRKRAALSQSEVAFLLGTHGGAKVCRYERFVREPSLESALAFEAIFHVPVREIFRGLYRKIEKGVATRAKVLSYRTSRKTQNRQCKRKHETVLKIAGSAGKKAKT
jgi:transcriptional regulator with XRE-family HTH domain